MDEIGQIIELLGKMAGYSGAVGIVFVCGYFFLKITPYLSFYAVLRYFLARHYDARKTEAKAFSDWVEWKRKDGL